MLPKLRHMLSLYIGVLCLPLAGCETNSGGVPDARLGEPPTTLTVQEPGDVKYYRSDENLKLGQEYFNRGIYGNAEKYFQRAVEAAPKDPEAWLGLAASYDRLARFDLADRAYGQAIELAGETTQILNNEGYSYMLRGKLIEARAKFDEALRRDPENPTIRNNINLLNASYKFIQRSE